MVVGGVAMKAKNYKLERRSIVEGSRKGVNDDLRRFTKVYSSGSDVSLTCRALVYTFGASRVNPLNLTKEV